MAVRKAKRTPRLPLPWERESGSLAGLFSGRRFVPLLMLAALLGLVAGAHWLGTRRANLSATRATLHEVERATRAFVSDIGRCPRNASELAHPPRSGVHYLREAPVDAWGHPVMLRCTTGEHTEVEVLSAGPSGSFLDDDNVI
jgi:hypothetical protein